LEGLLREPDGRKPHLAQLTAVKIEFEVLETYGNKGLFVFGHSNLRRGESLPSSSFVLSVPIKALLLESFAGLIGALKPFVHPLLYDRKVRDARVTES
jgi:hypothetical protein